MSAQQPPRWIPVLRDLVCMGVGGWGFVHQITHTPDPVAVVACIAALGGPAVIAAWSLGRTPAAGGDATTASSGPSPQPQQPEPVSPRSSPAGRGDPG